MSVRERSAIDQGFPHHVLDGCETALVVFCTAFGGNQDARWIRDAGLTATCIDNDADGLQVLKNSYPPDWSFRCVDAYAFPGMTDEVWDVVTLDPWTNQFQRCADLIEDWCRMARYAVVIGTGPATIVRPPDGWRVADVRRRSDFNGGVFWSVLERA